jgi:hypothetical protein
MDADGSRLTLPLTPAVQRRPHTHKEVRLRSAGLPLIPGSKTTRMGQNEDAHILAAPVPAAKRVVDGARRQVDNTITSTRSEKRRKCSD